LAKLANASIAAPETRVTIIFVMDVSSLLYRHRHRQTSSATYPPRSDCRERNATAELRR
jgi:hypothetical protein